MVRNLDQILSARAGMPADIVAMLKWLPYLPIRLRKILLDVAQTGERTNGPYRKRITTPSSETICSIQGENGRYLTWEDWEGFEIAIVRTTMTRSVASMLIRCEVYDGDQDIYEVWEEGKSKEILATQNIFRDGQVINYSAMFTHGGYFWTENTPLSRRWNNLAPQIVRNFVNSIAQMPIIFPLVQRKKNMSRDTCRNLVVAGYTGKSLWTQYGTVDLERWYYRSGEQIGGALETRMAWRYNDLKPRVYYCVGGDAYWRARFAKPIAVALMEACKVSCVSRRTNPETINAFLEETDNLVIWDYSSFTSTLSELKFFMYWLARSLEDNRICQSRPLRLVDSRLGIVEKPIWELLDEYNEGVNIGCLTVLDRVVDVMAGESDTLMLMNNGGLGVAGNIGFSTALHGVHIAAISGEEDKGCAVGDDALLFTPYNKETVIKHLAEIGEVSVEKSDFIENPLSTFDSNEMEQMSKFLKRRLTRTADGFWIDRLFDIPILPIIFQIDDKHHTIQPKTEEELIRLVGDSVGSLFWSINDWSMLVSDEDLEMVMAICKVVYRYYSLPVGGNLPHYSQRARYSEVVLPSLQIDPRYGDWAEMLWDLSHGRIADLPCINDARIEPATFSFVGQTFVCTSTALLRFLEDLGLVEECSRHKEKVIVSDSNKRRFIRYIRGNGRYLSTYRYIEEPSDVLKDVIAQFDTSDPHGNGEGRFGLIDHVIGW